MSGGPQFAPQTNSTPGSPVSAALLNGLVQAQGYVQTGGVPPTSASLVVTMPLTQAVVPITGGLSVWVSMASGTITLPASNDSYIDLVSTTTYPYTGSYIVASVANGAAAPAVAANGLRLCKVVASGTAATAVTGLALTTPFTGVRQLKSGTQASAGSLTSTSIVDWPGTPTVSISTSSGTSLECRVAISASVTGGFNATASVVFYVNVDGTQTLLCIAPAYLNGSGVAALSVSGLASVAISAGTHTVKVQANVVAGSFTVSPTATGVTILEVLEVV
jgi:hypothetical protein